MAYSVDLAYLDYFKNAAEGMYDRSPVQDRLKVTAFAAGTLIVGGFRIVGRVISVIIELAKVIFYSLASLFTLGNYGNAARLKDHCKLLALNMAALVAQPLQMVFHGIATVIGIITPMVAYRIMQVGTASLAWMTSQENKVWQQYDTPKVYTKISDALKSKITNIFNRSPRPVQLAMKTIVNEFSCALDSALVAPIGYANQFYSFGANPKTLTERQKKLTPILLLNGNYSHQGTFLPLLHALKLANNERPVYTINLPPNTCDPCFISPKIEAIKQQYGMASDALLDIDMVGHSMGSGLIQEICSFHTYCSFPNEGPKVKIRVAITVGAPFRSRADANIPRLAFDIIGSEDCLVNWKGVLQQQLEVKTGHLGLLFHHESLNAMTVALSVE